MRRFPATSVVFVRHTLHRRCMRATPWSFSRPMQEEREAERETLFEIYKIQGHHAFRESRWQEVAFFLGAALKHLGIDSVQKSTP